MNAKLSLRLLKPTLLLAGLLAGLGARAESPPDPGHLFYTPAQRVQLEQARARNITQRTSGENAAAPSAPVRYDGVVIRSDGRATHWVDGRPQHEAAGAAGLKPGQVRAEGRVYEPYQVLRPSPAAAPAEKPGPAAAESAARAP